MKKLTTAILSLAFITSTLSAAGITASANFREIYWTSSEDYELGALVYEPFDEFNDNFTPLNDQIIYKSTQTYNGSTYSFRNGIPGDSTYGSAFLYFDTYEYLTEDEAAALIAFLDENYPEILITFKNTSYIYTDDGTKIETGDYKLDYGEELGIEQKLDIAIAIKQELGLEFSILFRADINEVIHLGDLDGDNTVNALDASLVLTYYSNSQTDNTEIYSDEEIADISLLGDYDGDGAVNALDASLVLKEYAETQTEV